MGDGAGPPAGWASLPSAPPPPPDSDDDDEAWRPFVLDLRGQNAAIQRELEALRKAAADRGIALKLAPAKAPGTAAPEQTLSNESTDTKVDEEIQQRAAVFLPEGLGGPGLLLSTGGAPPTVAAAFPPSAAPPPPKVTVAVPSHATPLVRAVVAALVRNGNRPMAPKDIAFAVREHQRPGGPDLGRVFDADPAATVSRQIHWVFQKARQLDAPSLFEKTTTAEGRPGYHVAALPNDLAIGTEAVIEEEDTVMVAPAESGGDPDAEMDLDGDLAPPPAPTDPASGPSPPDAHFVPEITVTLAPQASPRPPPREMTASPARSISPHPSAPATPPKPRLPPPQPLLLSSREFALCANLSLPPEQFVAAAVQLEDECKRSGGLREKDAAMLASWLPWTREQWEGFWGFLLRHRYVWLRPKKRGADGKEAESEDEGGLFPAVPFYRLPEADNGKLDVSDLLFSASGAASEASDDVGRRWGGRTGRYGGGVRMPAGVGRVPGRRIVNGSSGELVVQLADGSAVRMVCPDCGKIAFNNLQGFVNHARISHGRYFPSHADAAVACGVPVGPEGAARARVRITDGPKPRAVPLGAPERPPVAKLEFNTRRMLAAARRAGTPDVGSEAGYGELRVRRADGTLARMVCPACGLSTFPDMPSFAAHLQDHGLQLGDPDAYAQPLALPGKKGRRGAAGRDAPALPGGPRARPTPRPLEISELPGYAELEPDERELCSHLRLFPESFMALKKLFTERCREQNGLGKRAARESVKMDVNKSSKVWEFLQERGLVWPPGGKPL